MYTPLHVHTARGSLLDSMVKIPELLKRCKELSMESCAITDHGNMMGVIEFYEEAQKQGIHPILGMEAYYTPDCEVRDKTSKYDHLVLLARTPTGYKNLKKLATLAQHNLYYKPRIDDNALESLGEGIIATSACLAGTIPSLIMEDAPVALQIEKIDKFKSFFDEFYLEIQPSDNPDQIKVNQQVEWLSQHTDTPIVITTDVHRIYKEQQEAHQAFISFASSDVRSSEPYADTWLKTEEEIKEKLSYLNPSTIKQGLKNTNTIAEKCNVIIELGKAYCPKVKQEEFKTDKELFRHLINVGLEEKGVWEKPNYKEYIDRVKYEFDVITSKGFEGYFVIMQEYLDKARKHGLTLGVGRGSAAGCLIAWILGITQIDSIRWNLSFERFLNPDRNGYPDIDTDVDSESRGIFLDIMKECSGENVFQIMTSSTMQSKVIVSAVGKVMGYEQEDIEEIKRKIPENESISCMEKLFPKVYKENKQLFDTCKELEGLPKTTSGHASAVVVIPDGYETEDFVPELRTKNDDFVTQFDGHECEAVGLVKFDILGLRTLSIMKDCINLIKE